MEVPVIPASISASALEVARLCLSRFAAENMGRAERLRNDAAGLGTAVHAALEDFVTLVYLKQERPRDLGLLLQLFELSYLKEFGKLDKNATDFKDGVQMLTDWFERADLEQEGRTVISCEIKDHWDVRLSGYPVIPFNYIWDRFDRIGENEFKVVDYKTNRWSLNPQDLRKKLQARAYGLAAQIAYPDAERIGVEFDMLRHNGPVGVVFTKQDNIDTFKMFKREILRIFDTDESEAEETLNEQCGFCVRKQSCKALMSNMHFGGVMSLVDLEDKVDKRHQLSLQYAAVKRALDEIEGAILTEAEERDIYELETASTTMTIGARVTRSADAERVEKILGPELWAKYGSASITMKIIEDLLTGGELDDAQKSAIRSTIFKKVGDPKIKTKTRDDLS